MATFDEANTQRRESVARAASLLDRVRAVYGAAIGVRDALAAYQAASDPTFNAAVNALFSASERTELNQMAAQINALIADWEQNHPTAIRGS